MNQPKINVTPLIDVLLVLLIIFIVVSPARPSRFETKIPREPAARDKAIPDPRTLVVTVEPDSLLRLNKKSDLGSVAEPEKLTSELADIFRQRVEAAAQEALDPTAVERTVFIKAGSTTSYGDVAKVVDAVKASGAFPISLAIDDLD
jgi:biopolymer transport protein ExbD